MPESGAESQVRKDHRVLVISVPKAGTYLMAEVLKALGYRSTGLHLGARAYSDYSRADLLEARTNPDRYTRYEALGSSLQRVQPGQFAVGHLPCAEEVVQSTAGFKRFYLTRDLRTALISFMRFLQSTGRMGAANWPWYSIKDPRKQVVVFLATMGRLLLTQHYQAMAGWIQVDGVAPLRFEDLTGPQDRATRAIDSIASFLDVGHYDAEHVLQTSLTAETITRSGHLTRRGDYWSVEAERQFLAIGGPELNARLSGSAPGPAGGLSADPGPDNRAA